MSNDRTRPIPKQSLTRGLLRRWWVSAVLGLSFLVMCGAARWLIGGFGVQEGMTVTRVVTEPSKRTLEVQLDVDNQPLVKRQAPLQDTENILVAGMDRRPGAKGSGLTDTLIVVALQKRTGQVGLISVPRDIVVEVPNHGRDRINTVYGLAQAHGENALEAIKQAVGDLLALHIEHAMVFDLGVFEQLVDTLGGVTVDVPCPIIDDFVDTRTDTGRRVLDIKQGTTHMDGATAAMYVRSRHGRSDFSRARRQQALLHALHRDLLSLGNLGHIPEVLGTLERNVATDLKRYELLALARRALGIRANQIHAMVISETDVEPLLDRGRAMLTPKLDSIDLAVSQLFSAPALGTEPRGTICPAADIALRRKEHTSPAPSVNTDQPVRKDVESVAAVTSRDGETTKL